MVMIEEDEEGVVVEVVSERIRDEVALKNVNILQMIVNTSPPYTPLHMLVVTFFR